MYLTIDYTFSSYMDSKYFQSHLNYLSTSTHSSFQGHLCALFGQMRHGWSEAVGVLCVLVCVDVGH